MANRTFFVSAETVLMVANGLRRARVSAAITPNVASFLIVDAPSAFERYLVEIHGGLPKSSTAPQTASSPFGKIPDVTEIELERG
jgi:hypothetical protein